MKNSFKFLTVGLGGHRLTTPLSYPQNVMLHNARLIVV